MRSKWFLAILVGIVHGYLLWTQTAIAPFWIKRVPPATEIEINIRWAVLVVVVFGAVLLNHFFLYRKEVTWFSKLRRTTLALSVLYFPTVILSQLLDIYFFPDIHLSDAFALYLSNWWLLPFEFAFLNISGTIFSGLAIGLLRLYCFIKSRVGGYP